MVRKRDDPKEHMTLLASSLIVKVRLYLLTRKGSVRGDLVLSVPVLPIRVSIPTAHRGKMSLLEDRYLTIQNLLYLCQDM